MKTTRKKPTKKGGSRRKTGKSLRVAMIGAGGRSLAVHYPSLRDLPGVKMTAVSDLDESRMQDAAVRFDIPGRYTNYVEMIEKEKPDAVYAILPPHHLYDIAATVLDMKRNLIIEKPPGVKSEQARQLAQLAQKKRVVTGVTFQRRYSPLIQRGKRICEKKGPVHSAVATFYKNAVGGGPYYAGAIDILTCDAIHAVDTLRFLCGGEVISIASDVRELLADFHTAHYALIRFSSGATGTLLTNWMTGRRIFSVEIHAPGVSFFGDPEEEGLVYADGDLEPKHRIDPFDLVGSREGYRAFGEYNMNKHFMDCIRAKRQPSSSLADSVKTMELVDVIYAGQI